MKEPQDASVGLEGRVSLDCEVKGHPVPRITWFKYLGKSKIKPYLCIHIVFIAYLHAIIHDQRYTKRCFTSQKNIWEAG